MTQGTKGFTVWFTGLSGAGKSTIAEMLFHEFQARETEDRDPGRRRGPQEPVEGPRVLQGGPRHEHPSDRLRGEPAHAQRRRHDLLPDLALQGELATRAAPRSATSSRSTSTRPSRRSPQHRDPKGLYKKALAGEITGFTGVDDPYEAPENPEAKLDTLVETPEESLQHLLTRLKELGYIDSADVLVEGDRVHSGLTDLRVTSTGHVAKES